MKLRKITELSEISRNRSNTVAIVVQDSKLKAISIDDLLDEVIGIRTNMDGEVYDTAQEAIWALEEDIEDIKAVLGLDAREKVANGLVLSGNQLFLAKNGAPFGEPADISEVLANPDDVETVFTNTTGWLSYEMTSDDECVLTATWSSMLDGESTGAGSLSLYINDTLELVQRVEQGEIELDVKDFLYKGVNEVKLVLQDSYGNYRFLRYVVNLVVLSLVSPFEDSQVFISDVPYTYVAGGSTTKTVHFLVDDAEIATQTVVTDGRLSKFTIDALTNGIYRLTVYVSATVNEQELFSNRLNYTVIVIEQNNMSPIVVSSAD